MVSLYILRHAKSGPATPGMRDFDRGLDERGQTDAPAIASMLRERGYLPPQVLCSPAVRTRMTLHGVMRAYDEPPRIDYEETLYSGSPDDYWSALQARQTPEAVMVVGHNPMCEILAREAAGGGDERALSRLRAGFPTGALAVLTFDAAQWSAIAPGKGWLTDFVAPREP